MSPWRERLDQFLDPRPARVRPHNFRNGLILLAILVFASYCSVAGKVPLISGESGQVVRAEFVSADDVNGHTPVRVHGMDVGTVDHVDPGPNPLRSSVVVMRITNGGVTVHRDARVNIRWRTLLGGQVYLDLDPGSASAAPLSGPIPESHTANQVELDQVLQTFNGGTAQAFRNMVSGLQRGFADPRGIDRTIDTLPALSTVARGMQPLRGTEGGDIQRVVRSTGATVAALGVNTGQLQSLVDGAAQTLQATDLTNQQLGQVMALAPATLDTTHSTMAQLHTTLGHLDPFVSAMKPGARALGPAATAATPALQQLHAALSEARPLLRNALPTLRSLQQASATGVPLLTGLDPTVQRLNSDTIPFLYRTDSETKLRTYEEIGPFFSSLDQGEFDSYGYRILVSAPAGDNTVTLLGKPMMAAACRSSVISALSAKCGSLTRALAAAWPWRQGG